MEKETSLFIFLVALLLCGGCLLCYSCWYYGGGYETTPEFFGWLAAGTTMIGSGLVFLSLVFMAAQQPVDRGELIKND